jgi:hypothetical protein
MHSAKYNADTQNRQAGVDEALSTVLKRKPACHRLKKCVPGISRLKRKDPHVKSIAILHKKLWKPKGTCRSQEMHNQNAPVLHRGRASDNPEWLPAEHLRMSVHTSHGLIPQSIR